MSNFAIIRRVKQRNVLLVIQPAYPERISGIARFARSHGWHLTIVDRLARFPRGWRGDGALVTLRGNAKTNRFVKGLVRDGIPVVDLTFNHPEIRLPRVSGDHEAFGRLAREHFESLNFRHFAWFSTGWSHVHELRFRGFTSPYGLRLFPLRSNPGPRPRGQALAGQPFKWVLEDMVGKDEIDNWRLFLKAIGRKLQHAPKPLAVLTYDDADAAKVLSAALEAGLRVPEDVAIMGIGNDTVICENQAVPLSSVDHDLERNGYEGAALLSHLMGGSKEKGERRKEKVPTVKLIPPRGVVVRKSTDTLAADDPLLSAALREISKRLSTSFGIAEIAEALKVPRTRLDRLFAEKFSRSAGKEIVRQRIERAKRLLTSTNKPMKEIAALCGYCNAGYFTNAFRAETGLTPKAWRRGR